MDRLKIKIPQSDRWVREYRFIARCVLGHELPSKAVVHHVNEDEHDNRNCNLVICEDRYYHRLLHLRRAALLACGNPHARRCQVCGKWDTTANPDFRLYKRTGRANGVTPIHRSCYNRERNKRKARRMRRR